MAARGYLHPHLRFAIHLPEAASLLEEDETRAVFALAAEGASRPAIVTVQLQAIDPAWDSAAFAAEALGAQAAVLGRLRVIDHGPAEIGGEAAVHALLQRHGTEGPPQVLEEWRVAQQGRGWTVSALCPVTAHWTLAPLIRASAESLVLPDAVAPLPPRPAFDAESGVLTLAAGELAALTDLYEGRPPADEDSRNAVARLEESGVVEGGRPQPAVADMLAIVGAATLKLSIQRPGAEAMAWWHDGRAALLLRLGEDRRQLTAFAGERLPGILADLLEIGPRPTAPGRTALRTSVDELAELFAAPPDATAAGPATDPAGVVARRRDHWRVDARFSDPAGQAMLEAIDAPGGWWLVRPEGRQVTLEPATATELWDHLAELAAA
jgi:hypothetical protein